MKKLWIYFAIISIFTYSCSEDEEKIFTDADLTPYELEIIDYFKDIALGFEFGDASRITRRWKNDMKIFVGGAPTDELTDELDIIIDDINSLVTTDFKVEIVNDSTESNYYVYFGSGNDFANIFRSSATLVESNWGLFYIFWDGNNNLQTGYMYVDIVRANLQEQKHLLREELTQSLGLARDSYLYSESIFQQDFSTKVTEYSPIDQEIIRLLYHPNMEVGVYAYRVEEILRPLLVGER